MKITFLRSDGETDLVRKILALLPAEQRLAKLLAVRRMVSEAFEKYEIQNQRLLRRVKPSDN